MRARPPRWRRSGDRARVREGELTVIGERLETARRELEAVQQTYKRRSTRRSKMPPASRNGARRWWRRARSRPRGDDPPAPKRLQHEVAAEEPASLRETIASVTTEREGHTTRLGLLDADSARVAATREQTAHELERLREAIATQSEHLTQTRAAVAAADAAVNDANARREATANELAQREADERIAHAEDRDATAAGEGSRRRLAEIDAELGMLVQTFACRTPRPTTSSATIVERYTNEPDEVVEELAAAARRAGAA